MTKLIAFMRKHTYAIIFLAPSILYWAAIGVFTDVFSWTLEGAGRLIVMACLGFGLVFGLLRCSILNMLGGLASAIAAAYLFGWGAFFCALGGLFVAIASFYAAERADFMLLQRSPLGRLSEEEVEQRNPRCKGCYARSFCPQKPGAVLDQYKDCETEVMSAPSDSDPAVAPATIRDPG